MSHTVELEGHVARVVTRDLANGGIAMSMSVATNRYWRNPSGDEQKETTWFRCTAFNKQAEGIAAVVGKGDLVYVRGRLMPDQETGTPKIWKAANGDYRANYEVKILEFELKEKKKHEQRAKGTRKAT